MAGGSRCAARTRTAYLDDRRRSHERVIMRRGDHGRALFRDRALVVSRCILLGPFAHEREWPIHRLWRSDQLRCLIIVELAARNVLHVALNIGMKVRKPDTSVRIGIDAAEQTLEQEVRQKPMALVMVRARYLRSTAGRQDRHLFGNQHRIVHRQHHGAGALGDH